MLSINTNLSSLIAQRSMTQATNILNQAIERMTTGYKINHAKDNAANYSIATNMSTQISAYMVAEDNALQGLDMLNTASESVNLIEDKLMRLRALAEQASNGTYGEQSKQAINAEANAIVDEIERLYNTTEYNGINLAKGRIVGTEESKFIKDIDRRDTSKMTTLASVAIDEALTSGTYSISTADELAKLATMTNNGLIGTDTEFVLGADIDLSGYQSGEGWVPIGTRVDGSTDYSRVFSASFDGNGFKISNLTITKNHSYIDFFYGLFGYIKEAEISNLSIVSSKLNLLKGGANGVLCGYSSDSTFENCFVEDSEILGFTNIALLVGNASATKISNCYTMGTVNVTSDLRHGGLCGTIARSSVLENCFSTANIVESTAGCADDTGGLVGHVYLGTNKMTNCAYLGSSNAIAGSFASSIADDTSLSIVNGYISDDSLPLVAENETALVSSDIKRITSLSEAYNLNADINSYDANLNLQVGTSSDDNSQIFLNLDFVLDNIGSLRNLGIGSGDYLLQLDKMLSLVSQKQTEFGAVQNRLESALDEISIKYENLVSSRSTIRDADIAEVSSTYIQQQILQQASATLLATANQSPSIALQLI